MSSSVADRARETGTPVRTMYRRVERFEEDGYEFDENGPCPVRGFGACRDNVEPPATTPKGPWTTRREGGRDRRLRDATVGRVTSPRAQ